MTDVARPPAAPALRSDVLRNRARILKAAEEVFAEHGAVAPLDLVVRRAGIGRGTLYRHFADREALVAAVYTARVDLLEDLAARHRGPDLLGALITRMWELNRESGGMHSVLLADEEGTALLADLSARIHVLIVEAVDRGHQEGSLHPQVDAEAAHRLLALLPADSALGLSRRPQRGVLDILLRGLRP